MTTSRKFIHLVLTVALCGLLATPEIFAAPSAADRAIVAQAAKAYYNLRHQGLHEYKVIVRPDWHFTLKDNFAKDPASAQKALEKLNRIYFTYTVKSDNTAVVTHEGDFGEATEGQKQGLQQIYGGMEQTLSGFTATWAVFVLSSPLPDADADYQLTEVDGNRQLTYKENDAAITTTLSANNLILETKVSSAEFSSSIQPRFAAHAKGLILNGYDATYTGANGTNRTTLHVEIRYTTVDGLQLPAGLHLTGQYEESPFEMDLPFSEHELHGK